MAELCPKCFIKTWLPNAYDIAHIVVSEGYWLCDSCWSVEPYVDYIDTSDLQPILTVDDFARVVEAEVRAGHKLACAECGSIFEEDDFAYTHETGECQYCHKRVTSIWKKG